MCFIYFGVVVSGNGRLTAAGVCPQEECQLRDQERRPRHVHGHRRHVALLHRGLARPQSVSGWGGMGTRQCYGLPHGPEGFIP